MRDSERLRERATVRDCERLTETGGDCERLRETQRLEENARLKETHRD